MGLLFLSNEKCDLDISADDGKAVINTFEFKHWELRQMLEIVVITGRQKAVGYLIWKL